MPKSDIVVSQKEAKKDTTLVSNKSSTLPKKSHSMISLKINTDMLKKIQERYSRMEAQEKSIENDQRDSDSESNGRLVLGNDNKSLLVHVE